MEKDLLAARARWLHAYFAGNVVALDAMESEEFRVISDVGERQKAEQLEHISAAVSAGTWFPAGTHAQDTEIEVQGFGSGALVRGIGRTVMPGRSLPVMCFTEVWREAAGVWKPVHLHYSEVTRSSARAVA